jgi:hypothetical protein
MQINRNLRLAVGIAAVSAVIAGAGAAAAQAAPVAAFTTKGAYSFISAPNLHPPKLSVRRSSATSTLAPGYFMIANFKNVAQTEPMVGQSGPVIFDNHMQPVWSNPIGVNLLATNLRTQTYNGKPALSWWQGVISGTGATTSGEIVVVNQQYRTVARLTGQQGWIISPHEFLISGNTAWVTSYKNVPMDLSPYGGATNGILLDSAVQQYNLKTGALISTWDAVQHIPLSDSEAHAPLLATVPWDAYHVNSVQLLGHGAFLTSMRNTWAAYRVAGNGTIQWTLGGKASSFAIPAAGRFEWQHDVELHSGNTISIFDDHCCAILGAGVFARATGPSRGLVLKLNLAKHTAAPTAQYSRGSKFNAAFLGNTQLLPDGNVVIGWGSKPFFSEYTAAGKLLLDVELPGPNLTYRAYVSNWVGTPYFPPSGAARNKGGKSVVYASWDGATLVAGWRVLAGSNAGHLTAVATRTKSGFETTIGLRQKYKSFKVQALDAKGHVLRTSRAFSVPSTGSQNTGPGFY